MRTFLPDDHATRQSSSPHRQNHTETITSSGANSDTGQAVSLTASLAAFPCGKWCK